MVVLGGGAVSYERGAPVGSEGVALSYERGTPFNGRAVPCARP